MAALNNALIVSRNLNLFCKAFNQLTICISNNSRDLSAKIINNNRNLVVLLNKNFHTSPKNNDLMEFFDDKKNWGENEVRSGRSWKLDELRIKSNTDLHQLWYVLLKEKNMLLTMEQESKDQTRLFPSPERIDKVQESMDNLELVVRERNKAYNLLETGQTGERTFEKVQNQIGLTSRHRHEEHLIPKELNNAWKRKHMFYPKGNAVNKFLTLYREKLYLQKRRQKIRDKNHVIGLIKRFPNMDMEALKMHYPDVDIEKCKESPKARGHYVPK